jgi:hypothetical protein
MFASQPAYETRVCRKCCDAFGVDDDAGLMHTAKHSRHLKRKALRSARSAFAFIVGLTAITY